MDSSQLADTDKALSALGAVPSHVAELISAQLGRSRIAPAAADNLLIELGQAMKNPRVAVRVQEAPRAAVVHASAASANIVAAAPARAVTPPSAERSQPVAVIAPNVQGPLRISQPPPAASASKSAEVAAQIVAEVSRAAAQEGTAARSRADTRDLGQSARPRPRPSLPDAGPMPSTRPRIDTRDFTDNTPTPTTPRAEMNFGDATPTRPRVITRDFGETLPPLPPRFETKEPNEAGSTRSRADTRDLLSPNPRRPALAKGLAGVEDLPELPDLPRGRPAAAARPNDEAKAAPNPAQKPDTSNFEILVDEEILELDADDTIIEEEDL